MAQGGGSAGPAAPQTGVLLRVIDQVVDRAKACVGLDDALPGLFLAQELLGIFGGEGRVEGCDLGLEAQALGARSAGAAGLHGQGHLAVIPEDAVERHQVAAGHDGLGGPEIHGLGEGGTGHCGWSH